MAKAGHRQSTWNACSFPSTSQRGLWSAVTMDLGVNPKSLHRRSACFSVQAACALQCHTQMLERKWPQNRLWYLWRPPLFRYPKKAGRPKNTKSQKLMLRTEGFNDPPPVIRLQCTAWPGTLPDALYATIQIASDRLYSLCCPRI